MAVLIEMGLMAFFVCLGLGIVFHGLKVVEINHYHKDVVQETRNVRVKKK